MPAELLDHASYAGAKAQAFARGQRVLELVHGNNFLALSDARDGTVVSIIQDAHAMNLADVASGIRAARDEEADVLALGARQLVWYRLARTGAESREGEEAYAKRIANMVGDADLHVIIEAQYEPAVAA
jgi:hypothetical protein